MAGKQNKIQNYCCIKLLDCGIHWNKEAQAGGWPYGNAICRASKQTAERMRITMPQVIGNIILILLAAIGLTELIRWIALKILTPSKKHKIMMVVPIHGHEEEAEYLLRGAAQRIKWSGIEPVELVCLDCWMDRDTARICATVCEDYAFAKMMNLEELSKLFETDSLQITE